MSDYLDSLVSRTLNLDRVVQPRLASLFEPIAPEARPEPDLETKAVFEDSSSNESASQVSTLLVPPSTNERALPKKATQPNEEIEEPTPGNEGSSQPAKSAPPATRLGFSQIPTEVRYLASEPINGGIRSAEGSLHEGETGANNSSQEAANYEARPRMRRVVRLSSSASNRPPNQFQLGISNSDSISAEAAVRRPVIPDRGVNVHLSVPPPEPETVVVTIGRVDVRAVFTPPTVARSDRPQQAKPMSLDEYLKQRREGRR